MIKGFYDIVKIGYFLLSLLISHVHLYFKQLPVAQLTNAIRSINSLSNDNAVISDFTYIYKLNQDCV